MRPKRSTARDELRAAVDALPRGTRVAMLEGLDSNQIIVGAYSTPDGVCPMLAAHRGGCRTSTLTFAKAWDRFAYADGRRDRRCGPRPANERELVILRSYLETSLLIEDACETELSAAHRDHLELVARRERAAAAAAGRDHDQRAADGLPGAARTSGDGDRSRHVGERPGWAWSDMFRTVSDYQRVLALVQAELGTAQEGVVREPVDVRAFELPVDPQRASVQPHAPALSG